MNFEDYLLNLSPTSGTSCKFSVTMKVLPTVHFHVHAPLEVLEKFFLTESAS